MARLLRVDEARAPAGLISITIVRKNEDGRMMLHVSSLRSMHSES